MKGLRVPKDVKAIGFEGVWGELGSRGGSQGNGSQGI